MKRSSLKRLLPFIGILPTLFLYQNCGSTFDAKYLSSQSTSLSSPDSNSGPENTEVPNSPEPEDSIENTMPSQDEDTPVVESEPQEEEVNSDSPVDEVEPKLKCDYEAKPSNLQNVVNSTAKGVICLQAGIYSEVLIQNKLKTSESEPFILRPKSGAEGQVEFSSKSVDKITLIRVFNSKNVTIDGFYFTRAQKAILYASVQGGAITNNIIKDIGMEAIHVGRFYGGEPKGDLPSSFIEISHNVIDGTGLRRDQSGDPKNRYGEGIYIGHGSDSKRDTTHDILIYKNVIKKTTAEAIELKPFTTNIKVIENTISDISLIFSGAITIGVGPLAIEKDSNFLIQGNKIFNIHTRGFSIGGIVVAAGKTTLIDNEVSDIEGGRDIRIYKAMRTKNKEFHKVMLKGNKVKNIEINKADGTYTAQPANVIYLND